MTPRALQPSPRQKDYSSSPRDCILSSFLPIFLTNLRRAVPHSRLVALFPGSISMVPGRPGDEMWPAVAMGTGVPPKAKASAVLTPKLAHSGSHTRLYLLCSFQTVRRDTAEHRESWATQYKSQGRTKKMGFQERPAGQKH